MLAIPFEDQCLAAVLDLWARYPNSSTQDAFYYKDVC